ncbi:transcription/translation regulatory transformer protein RfaH [Stutzerimonas stutzeri]|uniref:transcription/translation regulatory transformer protein RfaH n=1 Tax=Stutzerimonas stutzeri TaxID=316 RepID=UPI0022DE05FE|nr:transcription/translation regulatory transformer protein RfaH [Stutzerimonas stutzeri]WBL59211.1 transcription/translation regulatory transformer protein RfaH [Stutzerimonas stutzeri]
MDSALNKTRAWYLVQCKPRQDSRAEEHLQRQGYTCYRPKLMTQSVQRGRIQRIETSLFPGYVFLRLSQDEDWGPLRSTRGVSRIVRFGMQPAVIPDHLLAQLQQHESAYTATAPFTKGDRIRITDGAFAELEAIFLTMDGEQRVVLLMNLLHRQQKIRLPLSQVRKL